MKTQPLIGRILKFLASVKLAVIVILLLGTLTAIGTFTEARYDALTAQKLVYQSPYMYAALLLLSVNLIGVMIDRWPWRPHHAGFVLAHIGILLLLTGAWITQKWGVDGTLRLNLGGRNHFVQIANTDVAVYATFDGDNYRLIDSHAVDFIRNPPSVRHPLILAIPQGDLRLIDFYPFAEENRHMSASTDGQAGAAVRFQLQNDRVNLTQWIHQRKSDSDEMVNLGPAQVILAQSTYKPTGHNEIVLKPIDPQHIRYTIFGRDQKKMRQGVLAIGGTVETPWMGLVLRVIDYLPHATQEIQYLPVERPSETSTSAVKLSFNGKEQWVGKNSMAKLFVDQTGFIFTYQNQLLNLHFDLFLRDFQVGHYPGTMRASSYASRVDVPDRGEVEISMNEPLKYKGYTFYQASFEEDEKGQPTSSILSVNYDPGRWLKYLGCILIVGGSIVMFYFKRQLARQKFIKELAA